MSLESLFIQMSSALVLKMLFRAFRSKPTWRLHVQLADSLSRGASNLFVQLITTLDLPVGTSFPVFDFVLWLSSYLSAVSLYVFYLSHVMPFNFQLATVFDPQPSLPSLVLMASNVEHSAAVKSHLTSGTRLPAELLHIILSVASDDTLATCCRVSQGFLELASPILYLHVHVVGLDALRIMFNVPVSMTS